MKRNWQDFIAERAKHLAFVHLTRCEDLRVKRLTAADTEMDMLVTLQQYSLPTSRFFGVQAKARDVKLASSPCWTRQEIHRLKETPFPLYLFLFFMDDDRGYYQWLNDPDASPDRTLCLPQGTQLNGWHPLAKDSINQIADEANAWYDAKRSSVA